MNRLKLLLCCLVRPFWLRFSPISYARSCGVKIGKNCRWVNPQLSTFGTEPYLIELGNHVSIGGRVHFITHDGGVWVFRNELPALDVVGRIRVGNNVFIGNDCIILPGVRINDNVVLGAGAVVTHDIPPDVVAAGVPAKVISTLTDYRQRCVAKGLGTKGMSARQKRAYLLSVLPEWE